MDKSANDLVSTHVVSSRMLHGKIFAHFAKNTNSQFDYPRITPRPPPPPEDWNSGKSWHFEFWLPKNPPPPPPEKGCTWSLWKLIAVSPKDTVSFLLWDPKGTRSILLTGTFLRPRTVFFRLPKWYLLWIFVLRFSELFFLHAMRR